MIKFFRISSRLMLCTGIFLAACGPSQKNAGLVFEDAWIRAVPPGMKMTAGYGKLSNTEPNAIEITSYSSLSFAEVSLHRTELADGINKMREVPVLAIAAGATIVLEPGSYHLMLMMPSGEIQPGQTITLEMAAADGRKFKFEMKVERR